MCTARKTKIHIGLRNCTFAVAAEDKRCPWGVCAAEDKSYCNRELQLEMSKEREENGRKKEAAAEWIFMNES